MTINQATDYAFRAVKYLAQQPAGRMVEAKHIAESETIPMRFLLRIMPSLIKAGIVKSQRGIGGGYWLARNPADISFLDVIEAVEGPVHINRCQKDYSYCSKHGAPSCSIHRQLNDIQRVLVDELRKHNFAE